MEREDSEDDSNHLRGNQTSNSDFSLSDRLWSDQEAQSSPIDSEGESGNDDGQSLSEELDDQSVLSFPEITEEQQENLHHALADIMPPEIPLSQGASQALAVLFREVVQAVHSAYVNGIEEMSVASDWSDIPEHDPVRGSCGCCTNTLAQPNRIVRQESSSPSQRTSELPMKPTGNPAQGTGCQPVPSDTEVGSQADMNKGTKRKNSGEDPVGNLASPSGLRNKGAKKRRSETE